MESAPLPKNERERLEALRKLEILDTPREESFDRVAALAARLLDAPIAAVSLVDENREWFKACNGTDVREGDRGIAFCAHTILGDDLLVIEDASADPRFHDNPQVVEQGIRFYAGAPLTTTDGLNVGALCVKDTSSRTFSPEDRATLRDLAAVVSREMELRLAAKAIVDLNDRLARKNEELDEFTYVASHDLQEPLRKLISFSELLP